MTEDHFKYYYLLSVKSLTCYSLEDTLEYFCDFIDLSIKLGYTDGIYHAIELGNNLCNSFDNDEQLMFYNYYMGNAWNYLFDTSLTNTQILNKYSREIIIQKAIVYLRKALKLIQLSKSNFLGYYEICTNLGNLMSEIGRSIEALDYWDMALKIMPRYGMAIGNKGLGLYKYGFYLFSKRYKPYDLYKALIYKQAHYYVTKALTLKLEKGADVPFNQTKMLIEKALSSNFINNKYDLNQESLGASPKEIKYRKWCLNNKLFLNPLNDLGSYSIAANDVVHFP